MVSTTKATLGVAEVTTERCERDKSFERDVHTVIKSFLSNDYQMTTQLYHEIDTWIARDIASAPARVFQSPSFERDGKVYERGYMMCLGDYFGYDMSEMTKRYRSDYDNETDFFVPMKANPVQVKLNEEAKPQENEIMSKLFEKRVMVNGERAANLTDEQIIAHVIEAESEIKHLKKVKAKSKTIKKQVNGLKSDVRKLVDFMDTRKGDQRPVE